MKNFKLLLTIIFLAAGPSLYAQINPLKSQYFTNAFLFNPAKAGAGETGVASTGFASQWNRIQGAPQTLSFTADAPVTKRMGVGLSVINDKSGLISRTVAMGSYSYKIPFSENNNLRFGLSLGYLSDNLIINDAIARNTGTDPGLVNYNDQHRDLFKAGFGATYHTDRLEIQSSWFNLNRSNKELKAVDRSGMTTTVKYSFGDPNQMEISPLVGYRQIHGFSDYFDAGVNMTYLSKLDLSLLYHTNKSVTGGIAFDYEQKIKLGLLYNTESANIRGMTGGTFELALYVPFSIYHK
jgi:type IX secretion system PorP/SprF family membrane protein